MVVFKQDVCPAEMPCWGLVRACTGQHKGRLCFHFTWCRSATFLHLLMSANVCDSSLGCVFFFPFAKLTFIRVTPAISFPPFPVPMWQSARLISEGLLCEHADSRRDENAAGKQTAWGDDVFLILHFCCIQVCVCFCGHPPLMVANGCSCCLDLPHQVSKCVFCGDRMATFWRLKSHLRDVEFINIRHI